MPPLKPGTIADLDRYSAPRHHDVLKKRMAADTAAFVRSLRNFLRGPTDDDVLRGELQDMVDAAWPERRLWQGKARQARLLTWPSLALGGSTLSGGATQPLSVP